MTYLQVGFELCLLSGPKSFEVHHMESWLYTIRKTTIKLFLLYKFFIVGEIVDPHRPRLVVYNSSNNLMILSTTSKLNFYFQAHIWKWFWLV